MAVFHWRGTHDCRTDKLTKCVREREQIGASRRRHQATRISNRFLVDAELLITLCSVFWGSSTVLMRMMSKSRQQTGADRSKLADISTNQLSFKISKIPMQ